MKVIHLISGLRGGGAEHMILGLCRQSLHDPYTNMKVAILAHINDITWKFQESGIPVIAPARSKKRWPKTVRLTIDAFSTIRQVMKEKPDTIHAHLSYGAMAAAVIKIFRPKTRIVFTLHNISERRPLHATALFLTKLLRNTDIVFPGTRPNWFQKQNAVAIANGIDLQPYISLQPSKPAVFTCLFIGRLTEQKNPLFLIEVAKRLNQSESLSQSQSQSQSQSLSQSLSQSPRQSLSLKPSREFVIRILGDGPLEDEIRRLINIHHLEKHIQLEGYSNSIPAQLASAHCLLAPSKWEGMPLAILEAGAASLPVVATPAAVPALKTASSQLYIAETQAFPETIAAIMNDYPAALDRAETFRETVFNEFSIEKCYRNHLPLWAPANPDLGTK